MERCGLDGEALVETDADPMIGETVDRYRIEGHLGDGAMGQVYAGRHEFLGSEHAIKILWGELACVKTIAKRFHREAKALSQLRHQRIVSVTDFGTTEAGISFLVMDRLHGRPLSEVIGEHAPLPPDRARRITRQIAEGLVAAHEGGFVHRDLKPANVMLLDGDEVRLLDFGIAKKLSAEDSQELTANGVVIGTPAYMAPEQISDGEVGPPADLYSLGVILFAMLTGELPFRGDTQQTLLKQIAEAPPVPPHAEGLGPIATRLLEKSPAKRFTSARTLLDALAPDAPAPPSIQTAQLVPPPNRMPWIGLAALAAIAVALVVWSTWSVAPPAAPEHASAPHAAAKTPPAEPEGGDDDEPTNIAAPAPEAAPAPSLEPRPRRRPKPPPTVAALQARLDRINVLMVGASARMPRAKLVAFEDRYLALSTALSPSMSADGARAASKKIAALERDVQRASRAR